MIIVWLVQRRLKMAKFVVLDLALLVYLVDLVVAAGCAQPGIRFAPCECGTMQEIVRWTGDRRHVWSTFFVGTGGTTT